MFRVSHSRPPLAFWLAPSRPRRPAGIIGSVTDEQKGVLPGVTVEARGPALQGSRTAATDQCGQYRLTLLPPGQYEVTFTLQGFATETRTGVTVGLAKDTTLDVVTAPRRQGIVSLSPGRCPWSTSTSTTIGTNLTSRSIDTLPTGRNYTCDRAGGAGDLLGRQPQQSRARTRSRSTAPRVPRTPTSSTASTRPAWSTGSRARSSTSSSSRRSTSRPAATRPSTAAPPAASST